MQGARVQSRGRIAIGAVDNREITENELAHTARLDATDEYAGNWPVRRAGKRENHRIAPNGLLRVA